MDILSEARNALEKAGYRTHIAPEENTVIFEDDSLGGFVWVSVDVAGILSGWRSRQSGFLSSKDTQLRGAGSKSWNIYSVFLTQAEPTPEEGSMLTEIEEDFVGTRKLARAGVSTASRVAGALLPLMPLQNLVVLQQEDTDERLRSRLSSLSPDVVNAIVGSEPADLLANLIWRECED